MLPVMYGVFKGIETIARSIEVLFFIILTIVSIIIALEFFANLHQINNLRPVLENGWKPIVREVIPKGITFPFGDTVTFLMIFPLLKNKQSALKIGMPALVFSGFLLILFIVINISILGVSEYERSNYPLLVSVGYINIVDFIQRLDSFIVIFN